MRPPIDSVSSSIPKPPLKLSRVKGRSVASAIADAVNPSRY
jgi:hypothetical protein